MAGRLTDIVEGKLLSVPEVFGRLEPDKVAELMAPGVNQIAEQVGDSGKIAGDAVLHLLAMIHPLDTTMTRTRIAEQVVSEMLPAGGVNGALLDVGKARLRALPPGAAEELLALRHQFVAGLTRDMQQHIESLVDIRELMVGGMLKP